MGKGGQAEAGAEATAFDPSLVGAFANACPGCTNEECCAPAATPATTPPESPEQGSTASTPPSSPEASTPPGSPKQKKPRYDKSLKVTTDAPGGRGDPADPIVLATTVVELTM